MTSQEAAPSSSRVGHHGSKLTDTVHGNVDGCDEDGNANLEIPHMVLVHEEDRDSVDNDLKKELHLESPCCDWKRSDMSSRAWGVHIYG